MARNNASFNATDIRAYITNSRLPVYDFNSEQIKIDLSNNIAPKISQMSFIGPTGTASLRVHQTNPITVSGPLSITGPVYSDISGQYVNISNFPQFQSITGTVQTSLTGPIAITSLPAVTVSGPLSITGPIYSDISGQYVNINNFPQFQSITGTVQTSLTGPIAITSLPAVTVSGPLSITGPVYSDISGQYVNVGNFPQFQSITGTVQTSLTGPIAITSLPAVTVSGPLSITGPIYSDISGQYVNINNFPQFQSITGTVQTSLTGPIAITTLPAVTVSGPLSITGPIYSDISGQYVNINNFPQFQSITGTVQTSLTGPIAITSLPAVTVSGPLSITGPIYSDISGQYVNINNFPQFQSITGTVQTSLTGPIAITSLPAVTVSGPLSITGPIYSDISGQYVNISNFPQYTSITGTVDVSGSFSTTIAPGTVVGITGPVSISSMPAMTISANQFVGITGLAGITGGVSILNTPQVSVTGPVAISSMPAITISANQFLSLTGPVYGLDDTGVQYPFYVDANGIQRTTVVPQAVQDAKYIYETDSTVIGATAYVLDSRERPGWYLSGNVTSTLKWYAGNGISNPPSLPFNKLQAVYWTGILDTLDATPTLQVKTADGSTYLYSTGTHAIYNGQQYLFYYGTKAINLHPELHPYLLTRTATGPQGNTSIITEINIVTASGSNPYNFLLDSAGLWDQDNSEHFEVFFRDVRAQTAEDNLIALDFSGTALKTLSQGQDYNGTINPIYADQYGVQRQQPVIQTAVHPYLYTQAVANSLISANVLQNDQYYNNPGWTVVKSTYTTEIIPIAGNNLYGFNVSGGVTNFKFGSLDSLYWIGWIYHLYDAGAAQYTLPVMAVGTGSLTNILQYTVSDPTKVIGGRKYLFAYNSARARQLHPELECIELTRSVYSGSINPNDTVDYILHMSSIFFNSRTYNYGVERSGYYDLSLGTMQEYSYNDLREFNATTNLDTLDFSGTSLKVYDTNLRGTFDSSLNGITSTLVSAKRGLDANIINSSINVDISGITITGNRVPTTADISGVTLSTGRIPVVADISGVTISSGALSVVDSSCSGLLNTINQGVGYSFVGNVFGNCVSGGTISNEAFSTYATWTRGQYGKNTVFTYADSATSITNAVSIFTKATNGTALFLGQFFPVNINAKRRFCCTLNLAPFDTLAVFNNAPFIISGVDVTIASA